MYTDVIFTCTHYLMTNGILLWAECVPQSEAYLIFIGSCSVLHFSMYNVVCGWSADIHIDHKQLKHRNYLSACGDQAFASLKITCLLPKQNNSKAYI